MEWIKITDCPPDFDENVLTCIDGDEESPRVAKLREVTTRKNETEYVFSNGWKPTHWLPILSPCITRIYYNGKPREINDDKIIQYQTVFSKLYGLCFVSDIENGLAKITIIKNDEQLTVHVSSLKNIRF